jgi:AcrR family transcriptional regulator
VHTLTEPAQQTAGQQTAGVEAELASMRRLPTQPRSLARVERMLTAAGELLAEVGYDKTTTTQVARRARVAIASVYQFFPDRAALVETVAVRYRTRHIDEATAACDRAGSWTEAVDLVVDAHAALYASCPGLPVIGLGQVGLAPVAEQLTDRLSDLLARTGTRPATQRVRLALTVGLTAAEAVLQLAHRDQPAPDPQLLDAARHVLQDCLNHLPHQPVPARHQSPNRS